MTQTQFERLITAYKNEKLNENDINADPYINALLHQYQFNVLYRIYAVDHTIGYILQFQFSDVSFYALDILNQNTKSMLDIFTMNQSEILSRDTAQQLFSKNDDGFDVLDKQIQDSIVWCKNELLINHDITCSENCGIRIFKNTSISKERMEEYLTLIPAKETQKNFTIYCSENQEQFTAIQKIFNTIQYCFQMRIVTKPPLISEGNGYLFFQTKGFIVGMTKYFNYAESAVTYYIMEGRDKAAYIFSTKQADCQALRAGQAFFAYTNVLQGGVNLHASALVYRNHAALLVGDKEAGKTTNLLFGLKNNSESRFMSNDIVHVSGDNTNRIHAIGSCRKITIRSGTVQLFDELKNCKNGFLKTYDSVGNPGSSNMQLVRRVQDVAKVFDRSLQFSAEVSILVEIVYQKGMEELEVKELTGEEAYRVIQKNRQLYYNGREKFWDDIFIEKTGNSAIDFERICILRAVVSEKNINDTWQYLYDIMEQGVEPITRITPRFGRGEQNADTISAYCAANR